MIIYSINGCESNLDNLCNNIFIFSDFVFISKVCPRLYQSKSNIFNNIFFKYNRTYFHLVDIVKFIEYNLKLK